MEGYVILRLMTIALLLAPLAALAEDLSGTWSVTARPKQGRNTCEHKAKVEVHQWLLAQNGTRVAVQVVGSSLFSRLNGTVNGAEVFLEGWDSGRGLKGLHTTAIFRMKGSKDTLSGEYLYLGTKGNPGVFMLMCIIEYDVSAKKM